MGINTLAPKRTGLMETVAAELTEAAYPVALRHGSGGSWVDLELELWQVMYATLQRLGLDRLSAPSAAPTPSEGRRPEPAPSNAMLERLVTYYGLDEAGEPTSRRFFSYKIIAGPGPSVGSGLASIVTLALTNPKEGCEYCQKHHTVETGGAAAAMVAAIAYLDAYHNGDRLSKVESDLRG
jgi:hypothetical protein